MLTWVVPGAAAAVAVTSASLPRGVQLKLCELGYSMMVQVGVLATWPWQP